MIGIRVVMVVVMRFAIGVYANIYVLMIAIGLLLYLFYIKWMDYRKMELFTRMSLPRSLMNKVEHVD